ncbi:SUN domain-containing protein 1-like [Halichondria panicea]|uniref:SUN domain-containing protein 1-like n=1 Tax=Halichondria panicea TaxID=6063 RepID=UPI00312B95B6
MATQQRMKNRRLEAVAGDSSTVRRSPRLTGRFTGYRDDGGMGHRNTHATISTVSSRPSLRSYGRTKKTESETSILNESGQSVPVSFDEEEVARRKKSGLPEHFFGLDDSDNESTVSSTLGTHGPEAVREYDCVETTRVYTPILQPYKESKGVISQASSFVSSFLYKCGSLIYLAATGVLCLDVIILHRLFNYGRPSQKSRSCGHYLFLLFLLTAVVLFLIGGALIPIWSESQASPVLPGVNMKAVSESVDNRVQHKLDIFNSSFRSDIKDFVTDQIRVNIRETERKVSESVMEEFTQRDHALASLGKRLDTELKNLQQWISGIEDNLGEARMKEIAGEVSTEQANNVKTVWINEVKQQTLSDIADSLGNLREKLMNDFSNTDSSFTQQLASVVEKVSSVRIELQATQVTLTGTSNDVANIKTQLKSHESQLSVLQRRQQEVLEEMSQFKADALGRIISLEKLSQGKINAEQAITIFNEELDKTLAKEDSALRLWLTQNVASAERLQGLTDQMNGLKEQCVDSPPGGLSKTDVEEVIRMSLERYSADRIAKFDFALENSGGSVLLDKCSPTFPQSLSSVHLFGIPLWYISGTPKIIIQPEVYPGDCWALNGTSGYATIQLKGSVLVTEVTIEHIPKTLSPSEKLDSAPKDFSVYGMSSEGDEDGAHLGRFSYDIDGPAIQMFNVQATDAYYEIIRFTFESNHGDPAYTCIYRVRVHGRSN